MRKPFGKTESDYNNLENSYQNIPEMYLKTKYAQNAQYNYEIGDAKEEEGVGSGGDKNLNFSMEDTAQYAQNTAQQFGQRNKSKESIVIQNYLC